MPDDATAPSNVNSIAVAPDGEVWLGTSDGVFFLDGEIWTSITDQGAGYERVMVEVTYDGQRWTSETSDDIRLLSYNSVHSVVVAPDGTLWFSAEFGGVSSFDGKTLTTYYITELDPAPLLVVVKAIDPAPHGTVFFGTMVGTGVLVFHRGIWTHLTTDDGLVDDSVWAIAGAPDTALWFGTRNGASRFDGETWMTYTTDDGLAGDFVRSIAVAPDGTVWFGTSDSGISRYSPLK